jgi:hypothetical protein
MRKHSAYLLKRSKAFLETVAGYCNNKQNLILLLTALQPSHWDKSRGGQEEEKKIIHTNMKHHICICTF